MVNYQNGKIYKIASYQTDDVYYGSTTQPLYSRKAKHKHGNKNKGKETTAKDILKFDDAYIELVENFPCDNKEELLKRERFYIQSNDCVNKYIPGRTNKEYREDNKEHLKEYIKEWRKKDGSKERRKIKITCVCRSVYLKEAKARHERTKKHQTFINQ